MAHPVQQFSRGENQAMIEGQPLILVAGAADTGRAPLLAALLRRVLSGTATVLSAGVLGHAGEPADPNVHLALEQVDLALPHHVARVLDAEALRPADLVIAVDQGVARIARMRTATEVVTLSELAGAAEIPDPHHMPLGLWIAAVRDYQAQVTSALPLIRERLGQTQAVHTGGTMPQEAAPLASASHAHPDRSPEAARPVGAREEHVERITRLLDTARVLPDIVDWSKLTREAGERLRALAALADDPEDFTAATSAMLIGLLLQADRVPAESDLVLMIDMVGHLRAQVDANTFTTLGRRVNS
jgi:protein-tyrosine phosphatase